jgi:hypothetical protein
MLSTIVAYAAWHWMFERAGQLAKFPWPRMNAERESIAQAHRTLRVGT